MDDKSVLRKLKKKLYVANNLLYTALALQTLVKMARNNSFLISNKATTMHFVLSLSDKLFQTSQDNNNLKGPS